MIEVISNLQQIDQVNRLYLVRTRPRCEFSSVDICYIELQCLWVHPLRYDQLLTIGLPDLILIFIDALILSKGILEIIRGPSDHYFVARKLLVAKFQDHITSLRSSAKHLCKAFIYWEWFTYYYLFQDYMGGCETILDLSQIVLKAGFFTLQKFNGQRQKEECQIVEIMSYFIFLNIFWLWKLNLYLWICLLLLKLRVSGFVIFIELNRLS